MCTVAGHSVWREDVGGHLRLLLSWEGAVLDITTIGHCRCWDKELTAAVRELLASGRRPTGMCSRRRAFPMLQARAGRGREGGRRRRPGWHPLLELGVQQLPVAALFTPCCPHNLPQKGKELCRMDYRAAARSRRIWSAFQQWLRGRQGRQAAQPPLALEMASRQLAAPGAAIGGCALSQTSAPVLLPSPCVRV